MPIKIKSYGGPVIWYLRKKHSDLTSKVMLTFTERVRRKKIQKYINYFLKSEKDGRIPDFKFLMLETINRCNGTCSFCPANTRDEKRVFQKMSEELVAKIVSDLKERRWNGSIFLQVNNEPFLDTRIFQFAGYIREELPEVKICIISNGTLLNPEKLLNMKGIVDNLVINDYSKDYKLQKHIKKIYRFVKQHRKEFGKMDISIVRRYEKEILATRAGNAPNKKAKNNRVNSPCIYPFTDLIVFPDGKVGMCCNDCFEVTDFGNANKENLFDIWRGEKFQRLRMALKDGRNKYPFCVQCDVVDAGSREKVIGGS